MLVYMVYDKRSGAIVHVHRAVDVEGRSEAVSPEEVLATLPSSFDAKNVGVVPAELEEIPSGRDMEFKVDVSSGALKKTPVKQSNSPTQQSAKRTTRRSPARARSRSK